MEGSTQVPSPETSSVPVPPATSQTARLLNVLAAPGEVFEHLRDTTVAMGNWLLPAALLVLVSWAGVWPIFSQPALQHQMTELAEKALQKQLDSGKLTKEQADQAREVGSKWADLGPKIGKIVTPVVSGIATPIWWGLILWLVGTKAFKSNFTFLKAVEVAGLANMIGVLDSIVTTLLIVITGNVFATPSAGLLVKDFDPTIKLHALLSIANVMKIWFLAVAAVGLARLSNVSFGRAVMWVFGIWIAYTAVMVGGSFAVQSAFAR